MKINPKDLYQVEVLKEAPLENVFNFFTNLNNFERVENIARDPQTLKFITVTSPLVTDTKYGIRQIAPVISPANWLTP
jgi:hypothetical protein